MTALLVLFLPTILLHVAAETVHGDHMTTTNRHGISFLRYKCLSLPHLTCQFSPTTDNSVVGRVHFRPVFRRYAFGSHTRCLVLITAVVRNLTPGLHGFHIHQFGDIRSNDGTSAGGHFKNPRNQNVSHGFSFQRQRHWGDFGNLNAGSDGIAIYRRADRVIRPYGIVGRGMVIHALADRGPDFQPSGASGPRQAHCVIGYANNNLPVRIV